MMIRIIFFEIASMARRPLPPTQNSISSRTNSVSSLVGHCIKKVTYVNVQIIGVNFDVVYC